MGVTSEAVYDSNNQVKPYWALVHFSGGMTFQGYAGAYYSGDAKYEVHLKYTYYYDQSMFTEYKDFTLQDPSVSNVLPAVSGHPTYGLFVWSYGQDNYIVDMINDYITPNAPALSYSCDYYFSIHMVGTIQTALGYSYETHFNGTQTTATTTYLHQ